MLLCSPAGAAIAPYLPGVDAVMTCEAPWMKATAARATALERFNLQRFVRESERAFADVGRGNTGQTSNMKVGLT